MITLKHIVELDTLELQQLYEKLQRSVTLDSLVLAAWQIGLWFARALVNHHLNERAQLPQWWGNCRQRGCRLIPEFNHLLHLRLAWVNACFDPLFADHSLTLKLHFSNR